MPRFRIAFRKVVYGDTGHAHTICQRIVEVDARDKNSAEAAAVQSFCALEHVTDWLNHADWMETAPADALMAGASAAPGRVRRAA